MTKEQLMAILFRCAADSQRESDVDESREEAIDALLMFIDDSDVTRAFKEIQWTAI